MLRSANFDALVDNCDHIEQIVALGAHALSNRYGGDKYLVSGLNTDGGQIFSPNIDLWSGSQQIGEQQSEQQLVITFAAQISIGHHTSTTPWLSVLPIGDPADTPNGDFA
ncbi:hypothetical protein [Crocosphaera sp.]|uniref:hypothetical protein n=1 Tax=Crocosphaera sp. TaxID=2729996 RepID=UPI002634DBD6|nr:hypothetical protein [Crocosphaera sp.]MDJ0582958.1 hypothetical protein [Crocosphaera sp.]